MNKTRAQKSRYTVPGWHTIQHFYKMAQNKIMENYCVTQIVSGMFLIQSFYYKMLIYFHFLYFFFAYLWALLGIIQFLFSFSDRLLFFVLWKYIFGKGELLCADDLSYSGPVFACSTPLPENNRIYTAEDWHAYLPVLQIRIQRIRIKLPDPYPNP